MQGAALSKAHHPGGTGTIGILLLATDHALIATILRQIYRAISHVYRV